MTVTERLILPVQSGIDWKDQVKSLLQTLKLQEGYLRTRWGPHSENINMLEFLIGWESVEAQKKFEASADFETVMGALKPILAGTPIVYFMEFKPYAPKEVIDAPFVELLTFAKGINTSEEAAKEAIASYAGCAGCTGFTSGFSVNEWEGHKVFVGVAGWESLEASAAADSTKAIAIGAAPEKHHVNFRFPVKGFRGL